jgi:hypothetical protein
VKIIDFPAQFRLRFLTTFSLHAEHDYERKKGKVVSAKFLLVLRISLLLPLLFSQLITGRQKIECYSFAQRRKRLAKGKVTDR